MTPQELSGPTNISGALRQNFAKYFNSFTKGSIISTENHHQELKITQINIVIERNTVNSRINLSLTSSRSTRVRGKKKGWKAVAHGCTIFPCYLGMEIYAMQRPNEQQQRLSSWAINYHKKEGDKFTIFNHYVTCVFS